MKRSNRNSKGVLGRLAMGLVIALGFVAVAGSTGCDYGLTGLAGLSGLTSDLFADGYSFPSWGLYDPTGDIQSVVAYQQEVYDWANEGWSEYILQ